MISTPLMPTGAAPLEVSIATQDNIMMRNWNFLVDTGATRTTIPKKVLLDVFKYTDEYIQNNKNVLSEREKPLMADGKRADVYQIRAPRMNIGGHEIQADYILTSDSITSLNSLLGLDILSYFKFTFDFDAIDDDAPHGRMFYEFRQSRLKLFTKLGEPFAYKLSNSEE